ncbi:MAG: ABC transporter ATP-binding protein/permease [Rhodospirillales bacterium]|nr:ABC transporter ATP-binding protein/permease [Rhodospirillales bacterium]
MAAETPSVKAPSFAGRFLALAGGYWAGERKWHVRFLTLALLVLTIGQVIVPVLINLWSQQLFDALEQRSMDRFLVMVLMVFGIIAFNIVNTILHLRVKRRLQFGWRQWLSQKVIDDWLSRGRHHQITYLPGDHDNPDGRIAEDVRISTEYAIELGHSLTYCVLLLISFVNILWILSGSLEVPFGDTIIEIPGYLLYIALLYAASGTAIAMWLGQPLVTTSNNRQGYEADFRFGLARIRENAQAIALLHGEADERRRMFDLFFWVRKGWYRQTTALSNMMVFSAAYSVLSAAFPILVAAPRYIAGTITLGVLMQTAQAFQQAVAALSWPIDNLPRAADWKASVERVLGLEDALHKLDQEINGEGAERICVDRLDTEQALTFQGLSISEPDGKTVIEPFDAVIRPGERVLIVGDPAAAIRLFRAVARVWPWGSGRIGLPSHTRVFFMAQRPYLPHGPLRGALSYPAGPETVEDGEAKAALERVGLGHLGARLDDTDNWDEILAAAELQRLGFARLLVRRPDWIFIEDATDALDATGEEEMLQLLDHEFAHATLMTIGSHIALEPHHNRKLVFERTNGSVTMREDVCNPTPEGIQDPVM